MRYLATIKRGYTVQVHWLRPCLRSSSPPPQRQMILRSRTSSTLFCFASLYSNDSYGAAVGPGLISYHYAVCIYITWSCRFIISVHNFSILRRGNTVLLLLQTWHVSTWWYSFVHGDWCASQTVREKGMTGLSRPVFTLSSVLSYQLDFPRHCKRYTLIPKYYLFVCALYFWFLKWDVL